MRIAYPHGKQNYHGRHHHRPPHSACGLRKHRGGGALEPEHQTRSIAVTNTIPVRKLENELVPYPYGNLSIDSTYAHGWTADPVTVLDGFDKQESFWEWPHTQEGNDGTGQNVLWYYVPQKTGARLKVNHIADYVDADGSKHAVDMTLTVNSVAKTALATRFAQSSGLYSFSWATVSGSIDLTAALSTVDRHATILHVRNVHPFTTLSSMPGLCRMARSAYSCAASRLGHRLAAKRFGANVASPFGATLMRLPRLMPFSLQIIAYSIGRSFRMHRACVLPFDSYSKLLTRF